MRRNVRRKEDFLKRKSEASKKSDNNLEMEPSSQEVIFQCDQCDQSFKTSNGMKIHVGKTNKDIIPQLDGQTDDIAASLVVKTCVTKQPEAIERETQTDSAYGKGLIFKCEDCEYTTREKLDLVKHAENIHHQCAECGLDLPSKSSLKRHRKEKHCENCRKVVHSYWHRKHMNRGDIYDVCGPD